MNSSAMILTVKIHWIFLMFFFFILVKVIEYKTYDFKNI